ncbi:Unconventional myosin-Id-like [Oopsacas minuta]|uniref:Unconventional myosin-Id-like n=1 Tax=Oopsacas minuta TaxID=111878 RepID=A0AAV7JGV2_9METZ|nr:Unconventional myosin-Id-like [Oopsacas minuta]
MLYLTKITLSSIPTEAERVKNLLIHSSTLLEAFGNARTKRNNNSSRFLKCTSIDFDFLSQPVGGTVTVYMLEKDRVVSQQKGDRNFHIFYRLLGSQDATLLKQLQLQSNVKQYNYLADGGEPFTLKGVVEKEMYRNTREAFNSVGFHEKEQLEVFKIIAAILHLGQVHFDKGESDEARVINMNCVTPVANLLGLRMDELMPALVGKNLTGKGEGPKMKYGKEQAYICRDTLAKWLYEHLIQWIVKRINENTSSPHTKVTGKCSKLCLIDIYGFEVADVNELAQLCINYCSENLQQLFITSVLAEPQQVYLREGIPWINVDINDNEMILKMIEEPNRGILSIIDEISSKDDKTDKDILIQMDKALTVNPHYKSNAAGDQTLQINEFMIKHYDIEVIYSTKEFIANNKNAISMDLIRVLSNSKINSMKEMWSTQVGNIKQTTFVSEFKSSVKKLNDVISTMYPLYVRCIRPNSSKFPMKIVDSIVEHQARFLNIVEHVKVRRTGISLSQKYDKFIQRYKCICPSTWPEVKNMKEGTISIMSYLSLKDECRFGKFMIFLKKPNTIIELENKRLSVLPKMATVIQTIWRKHHAKRLVRKIRAVYTIMAWYKKCKLKNYFNVILKAFKGVESMRDLGYSIEWPDKYPPAIKQGVENMKKIHFSWRAKKLQAPFTTEQIKMITLMGAAHTALYGAKSDWGLHHPWEGDLLGKELNPKILTKYTQSILKLKTALQDGNVIWSATVIRLTSSMKSEEMHLVLTDKHLYRLEGSKFEVKKKYPHLTFDKIGHISLFPGPDQAAVLHLDKAGDLAFFLPGKRCIGEFIGNYIKAAKKLNIQTPIEVSAKISLNLDGKMKELVLVESNVPKPVFHKGQKNQIVLAWSLIETKE